MFEKIMEHSMGVRKCLVRILGIGVLFLPLFSYSQDIQTDTLRSINLNEALEIAKDNNLQLKNAALKVKQADESKPGILDMEELELSYMRGQINSDAVDQCFQVVQEIGSPLRSVYENKKYDYLKKAQETKQKLIQKQILRDVKLAYFDWIYLFNKEKILQEKVDLYNEFRRISELNNELGETALLEYTTAETKFLDVRNQLSTVYNDMAIAKNNLQNLLNINHTIVPAQDTMKIYRIPYQVNASGNYKSQLLQDYYKQQLNATKQQLKMNKAAYFPDIKLGYFNQEINNEKGFDGLIFGISLPLWFLPQKKEIQEAKIQTRIDKNRLKLQMNKQDKEIKNLAHELNTNHKQIIYYREKALKQADMLLNTAKNRYDSEDIEYYEYMQSLKNAYEIKLDYLRIVKRYNKTAAKLEFYIN